MTVLDEVAKDLGYEPDSVSTTLNAELTSGEAKEAAQAAQLAQLTAALQASAMSMTALTNLNSQLKTQLAQIEQQVAQNPATSPLEAQLNGSSTIATISYPARPYPLTPTVNVMVITDPRFYPGDVTPALDSFFSQFPDLVAAKALTDNDAKLNAAQAWIVNHCKYQTDMQTWGVTQYWVTPLENVEMYNKQGFIWADCDSGAQFMYALGLWLGIPYYLMRLNAGDVPDGSTPEGHCYLTYAREGDYKFVYMDWCWFPVLNIPMTQREVQGEDANQYFPNVWFSWNHKLSFSNGPNGVTGVPMGTYAQSYVKL
jgi:predicted transglutaminase-like cysteine proteinase